jgi:hypothetical protein
VFGASFIGQRVELVRNGVPLDRGIEMRRIEGRKPSAKTGEFAGREPLNGLLDFFGSCHVVDISTSFVAEKTGIAFGTAARDIGSLEYPREYPMIRKLSSGEYRLYSRKVNPKTGKRRNLGTFKSRAAAEKHERDVQYFKRH